MSNPRVSVICIFFDEERFLAEAIDSVLAQDFPNFELLLVDDGSQDASAQIARDYAARDPQRIRYLEHPAHANRGMSATRNLGLAAARGEYVAMIDGDDVWEPAKLSQQVAILDREPALGMVCGGYLDWRSWAGGIDAVRIPGPAAPARTFPPETTLAVYPFGPAQSGTNALVRRELALRVGGWEEAFRGFYEDQAFLAKAFLEAGVFWSPQVWFRYRRHAESCTMNIAEADKRRAAERFIDWFEGYLARREVPGREAIERALRARRRDLRHPLLGKLRRRLRRFLSRSQSIER